MGNDKPILDNALKEGEDGNDTLPMAGAQSGTHDEKKAHNVGNAPDIQNPQDTQGKQNTRNVQNGLKRRVRYPLSMRLWHWVNALSLLILLMSGFSIFNAHPRLYWGEYGSYDDVGWLVIASDGERANLRVGSVNIETTGVLGLWTDGEGRKRELAFPSWATLPSGYSLADGRLWHFFFAWVLSLSLLSFIIFSLINGHIRSHLLPRQGDWAWQSFRRAFADHMPFRRNKSSEVTMEGIEPRTPTTPVDADRTDHGHHYNIVQKLIYIIVIFLLIPIMIQTGLAMSPAMDAAWPWLTDIWGGRMTARSVHFLVAFTLLAFFLLHIFLVLIRRPLEQLRAIITGKEWV